MPGGFTIPAGDSLRLVTGRFTAPTLANIGTLIAEDLVTVTSTGTILASVGAGGARTLAATLLDNLGTVTVGAPLTANTAIDQRNVVTVASPNTLTTAGLLRLFAGSTTTVNGTLVRSGGCTNLGGALGGSKTFAPCP